MTRIRTETVLAGHADRYRGTFAPADPAPALGEQLPPAWEGIYFPFEVALADLRPDGSPARDGVIPEVDLPRRLYAGEDTEFLLPVRYGEEVTQRTSLGSVVEKDSARGRLVFVDLVREYTVGGQVAIRSTWHDVFLPAAADPAEEAKPARRDPAAAESAQWVEEVVLDARQLFRFSALTFNTHLIHYDRGWARNVEGVPDLLVHGPLTRILLMDAARRHHPDRAATSLEMRATAPMFVDQPVRLCGRTEAVEEESERTRVTAVDADDAVVATADIQWA